MEELPNPFQNAYIPVGTLISYAGLNPRSLESLNWLICDGRSLSSLDKRYQNLYAVVGVQYGGTGVMFNLPDLRGMFLRGVGSGTDNDPDIALRYQQGDPTKHPISPQTDPVGSVQDDAFQSHVHGTNAIANTSNGWELSGVGSYDVTAAEIGSSGTSAETRPKNVYVYFLIYAGPQARED